MTATTTGTTNGTESSGGSPTSAAAGKSTYRAVALDLDGTLLNGRHRLSSRTVRGLRDLHEGGVRIIFATGRAISTVYEHIASLGLPAALPVVCSNGAAGLLCRVVDSDDRSDPKAPSMTSRSQQQQQQQQQEHDEDDDVVTVHVDGGRVVQVRSQRLFLTTVPQPVVRAAIRVATRLRHVVQYYVRDEIYANPSAASHHRLTEEYMRLTGSRTIYVPSQDFESHVTALGEPTKVLILFPPSEQDHVLQSLEHELSLSLQNGNANNSSASVHAPPKVATLIRGHLGWFCEVLHPHVHKGAGLERLCTQHLHVPLSQVVAFGDGDNDIEFLQMSGRGIAMQNARTVVKDVADEVIEYTNDEDGVIRTLCEMKKRGLFSCSITQPSTEIIDP